MKKTIAVIALLLCTSVAFARGGGLLQLGAGIVVASGGGGGGSATDYSTDANCVGAWRMNADGSTAETDRTTNGNDLAVSTDDTIPQSATVPSGYSGYSRDFESSEAAFLYIADGTELDITGTALSIVAWVRVESVSSNDDGRGGIVSKWGVSGTNWQYATATNYQAAGEFAFRFSLASGTSTGTGMNSATTNYTTGTWYHVAFVYNGTDMRIYVNGSLDCSPVSFTSSLYNGGAVFQIGVMAGNTYGEFDGLIDEVGVFDRALTAEEVGNIYNNGLFGDKGAGD